MNIKVPGTQPMTLSFLDDLIGGKPVKKIIVCQKHSREMFDDPQLNPPDKNGYVRLCMRHVTLSNGVEVELFGPSTWDYSIVAFS